MNGLPSPPVSIASEKKHRPLMVKPRDTPLAAQVKPAADVGKIQRFISFMLAAWTTMMANRASSASSTPAPTSSSSSGSSSSKAGAKWMASAPPTPTSPIAPVSGAMTKRDHDDTLPRMVQQCLDALLFTSAMVITVLHYFSGDLDKQEPIKPTRVLQHPAGSLRRASSVRAASSSMPAPTDEIIMDIHQLRQWHQQKERAPLMLMEGAMYDAGFHRLDSKQDRIMAWATAATAASDHEVTQMRVPDKNDHDQYDNALFLDQNDWDDDEKYTFHEGSLIDDESTTPAAAMAASAASGSQFRSFHGIASLAPPSFEAKSTTSSTHSKQSYNRRQDRRLAKMEVQLNTLIQQGQAALAKKIKAKELDPHEIEHRRRCRLQALENAALDV